VRLPHWDNFVPIRSLNELLALVVVADPSVSQPGFSTPLLPEFAGAPPPPTRAGEKFLPPFVLDPHAATFLSAVPNPSVPAGLLPIEMLYAKGLSQVLHIRVYLGRGPLPIESVAPDVAQYLKVPFNLQVIDVPNVEAFLRKWSIYFKLISDHSRLVVSLV